MEDKQRSNWQQIKDSMKDPPPERLARIEYQSHFLQMIGITFVCIFLIYKGFWYIIFALIFGVGISYSQGMNAYKKYNTIKQYTPEMNPRDFENDISPTRRRSNIVKYVYGEKVNWGIAIVSVLMTLFIVDPTIGRLKLSFLYPSLILTLYFGLYFGVAYWFAYPIYKIRVKGGSKNAKQR
ncbi:hypothetical protein LCGC14_1241500 [marine sediment metagenome]|uniref:Uncharacterized protein n=1 Tax=marine sediment metagenome TaxID=412755 RepID=A0A0F9P9W0_9ZZZZ